jgi:hypothetical protein
MTLSGTNALDGLFAHTDRDIAGLGEVREDTGTVLRFHDPFHHVLWATLGRIPKLRHLRNDNLFLGLRHPDDLVLLRHA